MSLPVAIVINYSIIFKTLSYGTMQNKFTMRGEQKNLILAMSLIDSNQNFI
jgi:hypothetical protein